MSTVYLAEKPSQARDIATALGVTGKGQGFIQVHDGVVTWAIGHLLEQVQPQEYNQAWGGRWRFNVLPMIPEQWKMSVVKDKTTQVRVIRDLLKKCSRVVIATDAGREGELIARELLTYCNYRGPVQRLWTSSLVQSDIKKALKDLRPGKNTEPLYEAALARSHADWLYGMNGSRAASLGAQQPGVAYPVGRVQTPTLAMVVRREWEIRNFVPVTYYELEASVKSAAGHTFKMMHAPAEKDRIRERAEAERRKAQAQGARAPLKVTTEAKSESPPLPYALSALQKDANRILGFSARKTLQVAQELYEAKAITYPRTDCAHLAESQKDEVPGTLARLAGPFPDAVATLKKAGITLRDSTFDNSKLTDHHGICPTSQSAALQGDAARLFALVAERYLRAISPDCLFDKTVVLMDANGVPFRATGKTITDPGFRAVRIVSSDKEE